MEQQHLSTQRGDDIIQSPYSRLSGITRDQRRTQGESFDKANSFENKVELLSDMNEALQQKEQSIMLTQFSDQERFVGGLKNEVSNLKKQLSSVRRQKSQLHQEILEDKRSNAVEREMESKRKQVQEDFRLQTMKIGQITETCDELQREQRVFYDQIKQKNYEIKVLLDENDTLRRFKREHQEQSIKIDGLEKYNNELMERVKSLSEEMNIFQTEKKDSQSRLKDEINKLKISNSELIETVNTQLEEISDCINMTNKYKDIIMNQQKNLEASSKTSIETNETILAIDELVRSTSKSKNAFLIYQGEIGSTYDILYILKNNIITLTKQYQDLKHSKNKYKNKCGHTGEEIKDLKDIQKVNKIEIEQLKTEKLLLQQQFEQTVVSMEQQINERNIEEMKLKEQLTDISSQITILDKELQDKEYKKFQTMAYQFASYVNIAHAKLGKLINIKQECNSFVTGYMKILDKVNNLSKQLQLVPTSSAATLKQRAIRKLKKIFKAVYFAIIIKARRNIIKVDLSTVGKFMRQSQKGIQYIESLDFQKEFGSLVIQLNVQQQEYYPHIINQQDSNKMFGIIESNIQQKINNKDNEISLLHQKFYKFNEEMESIAIQKESEQKMQEQMKKKIQEQEFLIKRLTEENEQMSEKLKFHRQHFVENKTSGINLSQDNFIGSGNGISSRANGLNINYQSGQNNIGNQYNQQDDNQGKPLSSLLVSRSASQELFNKFKQYDIESRLTSPMIRNNSSNIGSYDLLKVQPQQINPNQKNDTRNNILIEQDDTEQLLSVQKASEKKQAYLDLKRQQQILENKLSSNQNEIDKIMSNSQSQLKSGSKRDSMDANQELTIKQNPQLNYVANQLLNQRNSTQFSKHLFNQSQPGYQSIRTNSINNQSSFANNNNYTFNNNSSAQLAFSDSQRKTKTIQDQLKQELIESQKFSKFLTYQQ